MCLPLMNKENEITSNIVQSVIDLAKALNIQDHYGGAYGSRIYFYPLHLKFVFYFTLLCIILF